MFTTPERPGHFIDNQTTPAQGGGRLTVTNPSNGTECAQIARGTSADIDRAIGSARTAFQERWGGLATLERSRVLQRWSQAVLAHQEELARLEAMETGKPISQARADAVALARYVECYAGAANTLHGRTIPHQAGYTVLTLREPHGVTGHIIPWNGPMQIFGRSVGAALAAGNACVVKPAENGCLSLLRVAALGAEAGLPAGTLNIVTGLGAEAGQALTEHPGIDHLSFTGSPETGRRVAIAGAAHHCPVTLKLVGKSPQIVFADADAEAALPALVSAIVLNAGQTCSAGSRLLIERPLYEPLMERLSNAFSALRAGPAHLDLDLGPMVNRKQQQRVWDFLSDAQASGIEMAAQGEIVDEAPADGFYQAPVLMRDVPTSHRLWREEVFGPVMAVRAFDDEDEAVALANGTDFGRVAGVWTRDGSRQLRMAHRLQAGQVFINHDGAAGGLELSFGGVKDSGDSQGIGFEAMYDFSRLRTVAIRHG